MFTTSFILLFAWTLGRFREIFRYPKNPFLYFGLLQTRVSARHKIYGAIRRRKKIENNVWVCVCTYPVMDWEFEGSRKVSEGKTRAFPKSGSQCCFFALFSVYAGVRRVLDLLKYHVYGKDRGTSGVFRFSPVAAEQFAENISAESNVHHALHSHLIAHINLFTNFSWMKYFFSPPHVLLFFRPSLSAADAQFVAGPRFDNKLLMNLVLSHWI